MALAIANYVTLETTQNASPTAPSFDYTPAAGVQNVIVSIVRGLSGITDDLNDVVPPTYGGTDMILLHRYPHLAIQNSAGIQQANEGIVELWMIPTTDTATATIVHNHPSNGRGYHLSAGTITGDPIGGVGQSITLPVTFTSDTTPKTISMLHGDGDIAFQVCRNLQNSYSSSTQRYAVNTGGGGYPKMLTRGLTGAGPTTLTATYQGFISVRDAHAFVLHAAATDSLTIDGWHYGHVYPADNRTTMTRQLPVSGAYFGSPTAIEVRLVNKITSAVDVDWTVVDASPSGGTWSGTLTAPLGMFDVEARFANNTSVTHQWYHGVGIGVSVFCYGQSNAERLGTSNVPNGNEKIGVCNAPSAAANDSSFFTGVVKSAFAWGLQKTLYEIYGVPAITRAVGATATPLTGLVGGTQNFTNMVVPHYNRFDIDFMCVQHGLAEAAGGNISTAEYLNRLRTLHTDVAALVGRTKGNTPFLVGCVNRSTGVGNPGYVNIRNAQFAIDDDDGAYYALSTQDAKLGDSLHLDQLTANDGTYRVADLYAVAIAHLLGKAPALPKWFIAGATKINNTTIDVSLTHNYGDDFTPTTGIEGFEVSPDEITWSDATAVRHNATTIRLTHASDATTPMFVRYLYGQDPNGDTTNPVTTMVRDNSDYALPLNFTVDNIQADAPPGPTLASATINAAGNDLTLVFSENMTGTVASLDVDGYALSNGVLSGDTITFDISQVYSDESPALDYVASLGDLTGAVSGEPLGDLTDSPIQNDSEVSPLPTVTTAAASNVSYTTADVSGQVTDEGREAVSGYCFVWATSPNPTIADNVVSAIGNLQMAFSTTLTGLPDNTTIYVRACAENATGTGYGNEISFSTLEITTATVTTGAISAIGTSTATVSGEVTAANGATVTERGVVWATTTAPDTADNKVTAGSGVGAFAASLTGLPDDTLIYVRAYAINSEGTSYGAEGTFTTLDDPNPTITSVRFAEDGTRIRVAHSEAVSGTTGYAVDSGTITYVSGEGTGVYLFSFTGTPTTLSYTPGNVVDSISQALGASGPTAIDPEPTSDIVDFIVLRLF